MLKDHVMELEQDFLKLAHRVWLLERQQEKAEVGEAGAVKEMFDFSAALKLLKEGKKMRRLGWSSPGMWVALKVPGALPPALPRMRPYFIFNTKDGDLAVWFPAVCDVLGEDWVEVDE